MFVISAADAYVRVRVCVHVLVRGRGVKEKRRRVAPGEDDDEEDKEEKEDGLVDHWNVDTTARIRRHPVAHLCVYASMRVCVCRC